MKQHGGQASQDEQTLFVMAVRPDDGRDYGKAPACGQSTDALPRRRPGRAGYRSPGPATRTSLSKAERPQLPLIAPV